MLWGNIDYASGNQKPVFANTSNTTSNSTINGTSANLVYGIVYGVSATEQERVNAVSHPVHAGWVGQKIGTGPIATITITNGGTGINSAGYLTITDNSYSNTGMNANISFTIANSQNTMESYSSNANWNTISSLTIVNPGFGFSNVNALSIQYTGSNITPPTFSYTLGGRAGRVQYETIVAMGSISGDDPKDNVFFSGI